MNMHKSVVLAALSGLLMGGVMYGDAGVASASVTAVNYPGNPELLFKDTDVTPSGALLWGNLVVESPTWGRLRTVLAANPGVYHTEIGLLCSTGWRVSTAIVLSAANKLEWTCQDPAEPVQAVWGWLDDQP
jgi:hypothetical protein